MTKFTVAGPRFFVRIDDEEGKLAAYVGGSSEQDAINRAKKIAQSLEQPSEISLGFAVDGCREAPDGKHRADPQTIITTLFTEDSDDWVLDANCTFCGVSGSRWVNPYSFNWD